MRTSYLSTAAFWCARSIAPSYPRAAIPLAYDRFPPTVQLWPWTPGHPVVPRRGPDEYCFPNRHAQLIRQKDHAAAPEHPTIGCLFWGRKGLVPFFLGTGVMWAGGQIFQGFCNWIILCDVPVKWSDRLQISGGILRNEKTHPPMSEIFSYLKIEFFTEDSLSFFLSFFLYKISIS